MPSRLGSPNKDKKALRDLATSHGVEPFEMQILMIKDMYKTYNNETNKPRSRSKMFFAVEERLAKLLAEVTPYLHGKRANITTVDETPQHFVIHAPAPISNSQDWLEKCRPKRDDAVNERPRAASPVIQQALDIADALDDAEAVINRRAGNA
jgi:hypothetical protein